MMIDLDDIRREFAHYLYKNWDSKHSMDGALFHISKYISTKVEEEYKNKIADLEKKIKELQNG